MEVTPSLAFLHQVPATSRPPGDASRVEVFGEELAEMQKSWPRISTSVPDAQCFSSSSPLSV